MAKKKSNGGAATALKIALLVLLVLVLLFGAFVGITYATNGYGGACATFLSYVDGKLVVTPQSIALPSGSTVNVYSFSDYTLSVEAMAPADEADFTLTVDGERHVWSEYAGEDMTAGFTLGQSDDGITISYSSSLEEVLSLHFNESVELFGSVGGELFELVITSGKSTLRLPFDFPVMTYSTDVGFDLSPPYIVF